MKQNTFLWLPQVAINFLLKYSILQSIEQKLWIRESEGRVSISHFKKGNLLCVIPGLWKLFPPWYAYKIMIKWIFIT